MFSQHKNLGVTHMLQCATWDVLRSNVVKGNVYPASTIIEQLSILYMIILTYDMYKTDARTYDVVYRSAEASLACPSAAVLFFFALFLLIAFLGFLVCQQRFVKDSSSLNELT